MKTFFAIIGGLFLLFLVWFFGFKKGLMLNIFGTIKNNKSNMKDCDPNHIGFTKTGIQASKCNTVLAENCINGCDKNHPGYDCNGFMDSANCGAGREANSPMVVEEEVITENIEPITTSGQRNSAMSETEGLDYTQIETLIATKVNMNPQAVRLIQTKYNLYQSGILDNRSRAVIAGKIREFVKIVTTNPELAFPSDTYCQKNWQYAPYDCFINWIFA